MNKINFKRIALLCVGLISLTVCIIFSWVIEKPGFDYTNEYQIYQDISKLTSIEDVETYLDNMNIQYEINESKLTLPDYDDIEYVILPDNTSGYILHSSFLNRFSLLDERYLGIVTVKKELVNNKLTEIVYIEDNGFTYTKIENKYYTEPTGFYLFILIVSFFTSIIILPNSIIEYLGVFFDWLQKRQDAKKASATSITDSNSENESKES